MNARLHSSWGCPHSSGYYSFLRNHHSKNRLALPRRAEQTNFQTRSNKNVGNGKAFKFSSLSFHVPVEYALPSFFFLSQTLLVVGITPIAAHPSLKDKRRLVSCMWRGGRLVTDGTHTVHKNSSSFSHMGVTSSGVAWQGDAPLPFFLPAATKPSSPHTPTPAPAPAPAPTRSKEEEASVGRCQKSAAACACASRPTI